MGDSAAENSSVEAGSRFLASTLHEVRTPIQTIISTTELLDDTALDKEQMEYVRQIEFSANVLLQLANDVLDFTKIRSKEFKLESIPFDITELTEHVVDLISIDAFSKGLEVITDIDYSMQRNVMGDPTRVQQILP
ncbi:MAG: hybrid sensor histidine kinase/response regulator, partial [Treponema sp.]|nr:hybrid sensor histidine kinase/response regulator [Treponema sp.]